MQFESDMTVPLELTIFVSAADTAYKRPWTSGVLGALHGLLRPDSTTA